MVIGPALPGRFKPAGVCPKGGLELHLRRCRWVNMLYGLMGGTSLLMRQW
jgi:hypothetical protein